MTSDERIEAVRIITEEFHTEIKATLLEPTDFKEKGELWLKNVKNTYNDSTIDLHALKILQIATAKAFVLFSKDNPQSKEAKDIWKALIMKGGGIKGIAYVGAISELSKYYSFNWYAGTSAGAIAASLLAAGYTHEELEPILGKMDFNKFKDASYIRRLWNLVSKQGLYTARAFNDWLDTLLASKLEKATAVKLKDLPNRVSIYASRKDKNALVFDSLDPAKKNERAAYAARCSMSIPFIFTPEHSEGLRVFDGGVKNNFPVNQLLKDNPKTDFIGLYLGAETYEGEKKSSVFKNLISIWIESNDIEALEEYADHIVIIDPRPISTLKFKLNKTEKDFLVEAGRLSAIKFLDKKEKLKKVDFDYDNRRLALQTTRATLKKAYKRKKIKKRIIYSVLFIVVLGVWYFI